MDSKILSLIDCDPDVKPVLEKLLPEIESLVKTSVDSNYAGERVLQLLRLERADLFFRGLQNIAPSIDPASMSVAWTTFGATAGNTQDPETSQRSFDYNPRKTQSYGDKFVAVLGQRPFYNTTAEAANPNSDRDRRGARQVNLLLQMLHNQLDVKVLNMQLFYYLYKCGTTFGFVRPVTDGEKYGYYEVPNLIPQEQCQQCGFKGPATNAYADTPQPCPQCGAPLAITSAPDPQQPTKRYPRTSVTLDLLNGYTTTHPFNVTDLKETGSPWIIVSSNRDRGELLQIHPQARQIVGMGTGSGWTGTNDDATAGVVRASAQSQTGTIRSRNQNLWTWKQLWIDPSRLQLIDDDAVRGLALSLYPNGLRLVQIEGKTVAIKKENYKKRFSICKPRVSDYLFTDGGCWAMLGMEDAWSNLLNIMMETLETGIMRFIVNSDYVDADALNRNRYSPNRFIDAIQKYGENIANNWGVALPASDYPQQMPEAFELLDSTIQNILGLLPQVYGQMPGGLTLGQARMMLNQGLMQLAVVAELATNFWEQSDTNMVNMFCEVSNGAAEYQGQAIDTDLIKNSNWTIKGDTAIPRSFAERVESLREILTTAPQLAEALKITDPVNVSKTRDYLDLPDFENPDVDALEALKEVIDQLWQAAPIESPPPFDPMTGVPSGPPPPPQSSIPFDGMIFDPVMTVSVCRGALLGAMLKPDQQRSQDAPGFANIKAFMQAAQQAATPPPPPPPPPKLSFSGKIPDLTPEQEGAVFSDFGITVAPPSGAAAHPGGPQSHNQPQNGSAPQQGPPGNAPPTADGPPSLSMPQQSGGMPSPGPSAMNPNGMIQ